MRHGLVEVPKVRFTDATEQITAQVSNALTFSKVMLIPDVITTHQGTMRHYFSENRVLSKVIAWVTVASTDNMVITFKKNSVAVGTYTLPSSVNLGTSTNFNVSFEKDSYLTVDVTTAGSPSDLTIVLTF